MGVRHAYVPDFVAPIVRRRANLILVYRQGVERGWATGVTLRLPPTREQRQYDLIMSRAVFPGIKGAGCRGLTTAAVCIFIPITGIDVVGDFPGFIPHAGRILMIPRVTHRIPEVWMLI